MLSKNEGLFMYNEKTDNPKDLKKFYSGDWCFFSEAKLRDFEKEKNNIFNIRSNKDKINLEVERQKLYFCRVLKKKLNYLHNKNYSLKFWKFLLDPWILYFLDSYITKWMIVEYFDNKFDKIYFYKYSNLKKYNFFDVRNYKKEFDENDDFHIKQFQNVLEFKSKTNKKFIPKENNQSFYSEKKNNKFGFIFFFSKLFSKFCNFFLKKNNYFIFNASVGIINYIFLNLKLKQIPKLIFPEFNKFNYLKIYNKKISSDKRSYLIFEKSPTDNDLRKFLAFIIQSEIPECYIEKFDILINESKNISIKPRIIINSNELLHNTLFKFWAAIMQEENNSLIVYPDHGGTLGICEHDLLEYIDYRFSWHEKIENCDVQVPSFNLSRSLDIRANKLSDKILFITCNRKKYYHSFYNSPLGIENIDAVKKFENLYNHLSAAIQEKLYLKTYTEDDQNYWIKNSSWLKDCNLANIIKTKDTYKKIFKNSKIVICSYPKTALCEAMVSGPTIILFDKDQWAQRNEFLEIFKQLKNVKIFFDDPMLAAEHINNIWIDPYEWWNSKEVRKVREKFIKTFALVKPNPIDDWLKEIKKINNKI